MWQVQRNYYALNRLTLTKTEITSGKVGTMDSATYLTNFDNYSKVIRENNTKLAETVNNINSPIYTGILALLTGLFALQFLMHLWGRCNGAISPEP